MKRWFIIGLFVMLALAACHSPQREARQMARRAERLFDTMPDSTFKLIDSILRMPVYFNEKQRMDMALLQGEALFGDRGQEIPPLMDDEFFDDKPFLSTSPELERAADYYAHKKQYAKAALAALYSGFIQQHYNEKQAAMQSFKDAERYGEMVKDSLTVARAEYWLGKMLYDDGMAREAIVVFNKSCNRFGNHYVEQAKVLNNMACCYLLCGQYDSTEVYLDQALAFADKENSKKLKHKILNNYAVLYRLNRNYDKAIDCIRQIKNELDASDKSLPVLYLNIGNVFSDMLNIDSAAHYYHMLEKTLPVAQLKDETKVSAYGALSRFAQRQGQMTQALLYREKHEEFLYAVMKQRQEQNAYRIQQQYDYESLQNTLNQKLARTQRVIAVGIVLLLSVVALFLYHLAKRNKKEAEINANLFHFMQQNKALIESNKAHEKEIVETEQQMSEMLSERFRVMQKLNFSMNNPKNMIALKELGREVFGEREQWDAVKEVLTTLYPGLWETIELKYPEMNEMERRVYILSRFKLSRMEEASLIGVSTSVLDKLRTKVRKTIEQGEKTDIFQLKNN